MHPPFWRLILSCLGQFERVLFDSELFDDLDESTRQVRTHSQCLLRLVLADDDVRACSRCWCRRRGFRLGEILPARTWTMLTAAIRSLARRICFLLQYLRLWFLLALRFWSRWLNTNARPILVIGRTSVLLLRLP